MASSRSHPPPTTAPIVSNPKLFVWNMKVIGIPFNSTTFTVPDTPTKKQRYLHLVCLPYGFFQKVIKKIFKFNRRIGRKDSCFYFFYFAFFSRNYATDYLEYNKCTNGYFNKFFKMKSSFKISHI